MNVRFYLLLLVITLGAFACSPSGTTSKASIEDLEKALEENPNLENAKALVDQYKTYVSEHPDDVEQNGVYLFRAAQVLHRTNSFTEAANLLQEAISDYYQASTTPNSMALLGAIYEEKIRNTVLTQTTYQAYLAAFPNQENASEIQKKISATELPLNEQIEALGKQIFNDSTNRIEYRQANDFINASELYATLLPNEEQAPHLMYKAAETARIIRAYKRALDLYETLEEKYPNFEKAPMVLFLRAFTLDNDLKRLDEAKALYEEFLSKYPDHDFADDTQALLQNLGKNAEEIIQSFENKEEATQ